MPPDSPIWSLIGLTIAGAISYGLYLIKRNSRPKVTCAHCGSHNIIEIRRDPVGSRVVQPTGGGTPAGGDIRLQLDYKVTYHCNNCQKETIRTLTQTH